MRELRLFGHYVSIPLLVIALFDLMAVASIVYVAATEGREEGIVVEMAAIALLGALLALVTKGAVGLYHIQLRATLVGIMTRAVVAFVIGLPVMAIALALSPLGWAQAARVLVAGAAAYALLGVILSIFFALADAGALRRRVLVLGADSSPVALKELRRRADRRGFEVIGFVSFGGASANAQPLVRPDMPLCRYAKLHGVDEIVVALEERRNLLPVDELVECRFNGIAVIELVSFMEREAGKVRLDLVHPGWFVFDGNRVGRWQELFKRAMDVTCSLLLLLATLPVTLATIIAIKREEGRAAPIFYKQVRVGKEGAPFELLKFRSMRVDAEADGQARWATQGDDRVTRVGRFIRKARIDEIPQLLNVLRGEMSLVGPRPERPAFVTELQRAIPYYMERHRVKPGVTGWAQLLYPYGASASDAAEKLQYDLYYLKNRSLLLDFIVLLQTVEVVLFGKGSR